MSTVKRYDLGDHNGKIVLVQRPEGQVVQAEEHLEEIAKLNGWLDLSDQALRCMEEGDTSGAHGFLSKICEGRMENGWDPFSQPIRLRRIAEIIETGVLKRLPEIIGERPARGDLLNDVNEIHRLAKGPL